MAPNFDPNAERHEWIAADIRQEGYANFVVATDFSGQLHTARDVVEEHYHLVTPFLTPNGANVGER